MTADELARTILDMGKDLTALKEQFPAGRIADLEKRMARMEAQLSKLAWAMAAPEPTSTPTHSGPCHLIARSQAESVTLSDASAA